MKRLIFTLLLFASCGGEHLKNYYQCFKMTISDGQPIQFWQDGCETFNQKDVSGFNKVCFCQPFQCDDDIKVQVTDDPGQDYFLSLSDSEDTIISKLKFSETTHFETIINSHFTSGTNGFSQSGFGDTTRSNSWGWESTSGGRLQNTVSQIGTDIVNTEIAYKSVSGVAGSRNYVSFKWGIGNSVVTTNHFKLQMYLIKSGTVIQTITLDEVTGSTSTGYTNEDINTNFTAIDNYDAVGFGIIFDSSSGLSAPAVYFYYLDVENQQNSIYNLSFIPEDESICDKQVVATITTGGGLDPITYPTPINTWHDDFITSTREWVFDTNAHITLPAFSTGDNLHIPVSGISIGKIQLDMEITTTHISAAQMQVSFRKAGVNVSTVAAVDCSQLDNVISRIFTLTDVPDEIYIVLTVVSSPSAPVTYTILANKFSVHDLAPEVKAYSDCIDIRTAWSETILINYSNNRNFAGLDNQEISPDIDFNLRIFAVFAEEQFPQEQEIGELSDNQEISLNSQLKTQRLLRVGHMPSYMHKKTILALMNQFVFIDGLYWVKADNYEKKDGNKRFPMKAYTCWLTQKDEIIRNIL